MAVAQAVKGQARARPGAVTAILSIVGYALVVGTFAGWISIYPDLADSTVDLFTHLIAVINAIALTSLVAGVYFIRKGDVRRHRAAMLTAFTFILLFLVVYLLRVGGGFEKAIVAPDLARAIYLVMLAIHILLSILAMPVVIYAVVLGLTRTPAELAQTRKNWVGRLAAGAWILSLSLGILTYVLLNHVYASEPRAALLPLLFVLGHPRLGFGTSES